MNIYFNYRYLYMIVRTQHTEADVIYVTRYD